MLFVNNIIYKIYYYSILKDSYNLSKTNKKYNQLFIKIRNEEQIKKTIHNKNEVIKKLNKLFHSIIYYNRYFLYYITFYLSFFKKKSNSFNLILYYKNKVFNI